MYYLIVLFFWLRNLNVIIPVALAKISQNADIKVLALATIISRLECGGAGGRSLFSLLVAVNRLLTLTLLFTIGINSLTHEISIGGTPTWQLALLRGRTLEGHRGGTEEIPEPSVTSSQKGYPISSATCSL